MTYDARCCLRAHALLDGCGARARIGSPVL
eukprot:SAG31_NODE_25499_length_460_cov_0.709141_1_plen_29_part_10